MKESMGKAGYVQGDMAPEVKDYQKPTVTYSQEGFSKTLDYIERHNSFDMAEAREVERQTYKGRYS